MYEREERPLYYFRHAFISNRRNKGVTADVVALHSNTGVTMVNNHYTDLSDDNLIQIHKKVFPEDATTKSKNNIKTKK